MNGLGPVRCARASPPRVHLVAVAVWPRLPLRPSTRRSISASLLPPPGSAPTRSSRSSPPRLGGLLWGIPFVTLFLGAWQLHRLNWKLNLIQASELALKGEPIPLEQIDTTLSTPLQKVLITGRFLPPTFLVGPRPRSSSSTEASSGLFSSGGINRNGYYIVSPFELSTGVADNPTGAPLRRILVSRGWLPRNLVDEKGWDDQALGKEITLEGILRPGENGAYMPRNKPKVNQWYWIDTAAMSHLCHTACHPSLLVELIADSPTNDATFKCLNGVIPIPKQPGINLTNNHLSYALTWFGLFGFKPSSILHAFSTVADSPSCRFAM
ncbi:hypothetical protein SeLEV6574_g03681 [Synchytrium endobioticum]|nr:hypothetical protein SeLEV6574_g03681 [Synchytrium endobioticum]